MSMGARLADFDVRRTEYGIEFIPISEQAWQWLRRTGKVKDLTGPNKALLREAATIPILTEALSRNGLTWTGALSSSEHKPLVQKPVGSNINPAAASELSAVDTWANSKGGCLTLLAAPFVILSVMFVAFCSPSGKDANKPDPDAYTAEDIQREKRESEILDAKTMADINLKALLADADSAKFKDVFLSRIDGGNLMLCGKVNAKNAFGAYTGFKRYIASPNSAAPSIIDGEASGISRNEFDQAYAAVCSNVVERF